MNKKKLLFFSAFTLSQILYGQVGIGTTTPTSSAVLDVSSSTKGVILPRVALNSATDQSTIASPAVGLLAYNTGTSGLNYKGYVFWNGTEWRTFDNSSTSPAVINTLNCSSATMSPNFYTNGAPYTGTLSVPYTGGNGGVYAAQTIGPINGLMATLVAGNLETGSGTLQYTVSGTPTVSTPTSTTFPISIGGKTCNAIVGEGNKLSVGQAYGAAVQIPGYFMNNYLDNGSGAPKNSQGGTTKTRMSSNADIYSNSGTGPGTTTFTAITLGEFVASQGRNPNVVLPVVNGLRLDFIRNGTGSVSPVYYNTTDAAVVITHSSLSTNDRQIQAIFTRVNAGAYSSFIDGDDNFSASDSLAEFNITNLTFPITGEWYQITWHAYRNKSAVDATTTQYFYVQITRIN